MTTDDDGVLETPVRRREVSGTAVVIGMVLLGIVATVVMYVYWDLHTKPFRPLTEAIGRTFKNSLPKVEGGRHKKGPMTLRVALRVPFPPQEHDPETEKVLATVRGIIRQHQDLAGYEVVYIHLFHLMPEEAAKSLRFEYSPDEILSEQ